MLVEFSGYRCLIQKTRDLNRHVALILLDTRDLVPVTSATISVPEELLDKDEVIINPENEGMLEVLVKAGVVLPTGKTIEPLGAPIAKILI